MRVIGKNDYYSSVQSLGGVTDDSVVLVLKDDTSCQEIQTLDTPLYMGAPSLNIFDHKGHSVFNHKDIAVKDGYISLTPVVAYVAGKRYNGVSINHRNYDIKDRIDTENYYYWSLQDFKEALTKFDLDLKPSKTNSWSTAPSTDDYFTPSITTEEQDFLIDNKISVAVSHGRMDTYRLPRDSKNRSYMTYSVNSNSLRNIQFFKVMDAYTVYQELAMWVVNLPRDGHEMVELSDKSKIKKHGMDKWSFRKLPQKR